MRKHTNGRVPGPLKEEWQGLCSCSPSLCVGWHKHSIDQSWDLQRKMSKDVSSVKWETFLPAAMCCRTETHWALSSYAYQISAQLKYTPTVKGTQSSSSRRQSSELRQYAWSLFYHPFPRWLYFGTFSYQKTQKSWWLIPMWLSTWEMDGRGSKSQGQPQLHRGQPGIH